MLHLYEPINVSLYLSPLCDVQRQLINSCVSRFSTEMSVQSLLHQLHC